ncbi:MAG: hypothetical protein BWK73_26790 [Thiothrix lacustris]|uniref:Uncharacterized protein n=1 Tax=Thiothrix lacustris TaxID=525917 RepID=A0A1Y1QKH6_9GAMM|nr:MAG: hypothetical protein BWK73_26790 [Thiothrix lacustris]
MKKATTQLLIAVAALAAALALTATAAYADDCTAEQCELKPQPWKEFRTNNDSAEFTQAWIAASRQCGGQNTACIEELLTGQGWKWEVEP